MKGIFTFWATLLLITNAFTQNYNMSNAPITDCNGSFFDSGGGSANYSNNQNLSTTICSNGSGGTHVRLDITGVDIAAGDIMCFYDGNNLSAPQLSCSDDYQAGSPFVVQATAANPSGCLTVSFNSTATGVATGWSSTISCVASCQTVLAALVSTDPTMEPADTGWIDICPGERLFLTGKGIYPQNNFAYEQSDFSTTFEWNFGDGDIAYGPSVSHKFDEPGGYYVQMNLKDTLGCRSINLINQRVRVAPKPNFALDNAFDNIICAKDTLHLSAAVVPSTGNNILVTPNPQSFDAGGFRSDSLALPDGTGIPYETNLYFTNFSPGQTLTSVDDLIGICVNMEHSWMRDIEISLSCPNGTEVVLHNFGGQTGSEILLGDPDDNDMFNPVPGEGADYCWTPNATNGTWLEYANDELSGGGSLPPGDYESFDNLQDLVGCPLNGEWSITVTDLWPIDNGYIFSWSLAFDPTLYPNVEIFTPQFVDWHWNNHPSIFAQTADSISAAPINAGTAAYTFTINDNFGCTWDTIVNVSVLPFTHPDCYKCDENFANLPDTAVCQGQGVPLQATSTGITSQIIQFEAYPDYPFGNGNHPHQNPYSAPLAISSLGYNTITDAANQIDKVCIEIETDFDSDLNIYLRSPDNKQLELSTGNGGSGDNYKITCFKSTAATSIIGSAAPFNGNYRPEGMWSALNGAQVNGNWKLVVSDGFGPTKVGKVKSWNLAFKSPITTTYAWQSSPTLSCTNCPNPTATPTSTTDYIVQATDNFLCVHKDTVKVVVFSAFPAPANLIGSPIGNNQLQFTWNMIPGATAYEVKVNNGAWIPANGILSHTVSGVLANQSATIQVRASGASLGTCTATIGTATAVNVACNYNIGIASINPTECFGDSNGDVTISLTGSPVSPVSYFVDTNPVAFNSIAIFNYFNAGNHTIVSVDATGCRDTINFVMTSPPPIVLATTATDATCNGENDGKATVTVVSGGQSPFSYTWQECTGNTTLSGAVQNSLYAGCYNVVVQSTMANATCKDTAQVIIGEPAPFVFTTSQDSVSCAGGSDGSATINVSSGGQMPYSYLWSNGAIISTAFGLNANFHTVIVTDANGCEFTTPVLVKQPSALVFTTNQLAVVPVTCFGGNDGEAMAGATGGTAPYTYSWENGQMTALATNLSGGDIYNVTATDANGCTKVTGALVSEPLPIQLLTNQFMQETCENACNGSFNVGVQGGVPTYNYNWDSPLIPMGTKTPTNLCPGTYTVTVTDSKGCTNSISGTIVAAQPITITPTVVDPKCATSTNGSISLFVSGPGSPFKYKWSNGPSTTNSINNLGCGTYTVTVTNASNTCTKVLPINLICPPQLVVNPILSTEVDCFGDANGTLTVSATGGTPPLTYDWNDPNNQINPIATNLEAGTYVVVVVDANGCQGSAAATVGSPNVLVGDISAFDILCFGASTGSVIVNPVGGVAPYTYVWNNNQTTKEVTGLSSGTYSVTITDANGCVFDQATTMINEPGAPVTLTVMQTDISCFEENNSVASAVAVGGSGNYSYEWTGNLNGDTQNQLSIGDYTVTATDQAGCTATQTVTITQYEEITANVATTEPTCFGANDGSAAINDVNGGSGAGNPNAYMYDWNIPNPPNATFVSFLTAGNYFITITDTKGCTLLKEFELTQPAEITMLSEVKNVSCFGLSDGAAKITQVFSANPVTGYNWSNFTTAGGITDIPANDYGVTVTDDKGCTGSTIITVAEPDLLEISSFDVQKLLCNLDSNATAKALVVGGTPEYNFAWDNNDTTQSIVDLAPGVYTVTVTDKNGCTTLDSVIIIQPDALQVNLERQDPDCYGQNTGRIKVKVNGGTSPYTYRRDNQETFTGASTFFGLSAKDYRIDVKDGNGCITQTWTSLDQPSPLLVDLGQDTTLNLGDSIQLTPSLSGGAGFFTFDWNSGYLQNLICIDTIECKTIEVKPTISNIYTLTVTDENGCIGEDKIEIFVLKNRGVYVPSGFTPNADSNNDLLGVFGKSKMVKEVLVFRIYDRWGELLYEDKNFDVNDSTRGWDGKFRDKECNVGQYVWYVEIEYIDGFREIERGNSSLIR
jgi:gliding motility-associated-like protein